MTEERAKQIAAEAFFRSSLSHGLCVNAILAACAEERKACAEVLRKRNGKKPCDCNAWDCGCQNNGNTAAQASWLECESAAQAIEGMK